MLEQEEFKLINSIVTYITKASDKDEKTLAFGACSNDIVEFLYLLDSVNYFKQNYDDKTLHTNCKKALKTRKVTGLQSIIHLNFKGRINDKYYVIEAKVLGPFEDYCEAIVKKDIKYYAKQAGLMYIKVVEQFQYGITLPKVIFEMGEKRVGKTRDTIPVR